MPKWWLLQPKPALYFSFLSPAQRLIVLQRFLFDSLHSSVARFVQLR